MRLTDRPVRPKPDYFGPDGAPPGIALRLDAFGSWAEGRPRIVPRVIIAHTNGASVEASVQSSINYGNAGVNNTKPHYHLGDKPAKVLATNRRAIANATGSDIEMEYGEQDCSFWTIAIETADMGSIAAKLAGVNWPYDCGPFLYDNADDLAHILAYESIVWNIPLHIPTEWNAAGVVTHTNPWPYPYYTIQRGKTCPGRTKIDQTFGPVLERAIQIRDTWLGGEELREMIVKPPVERPGGAWFYVCNGNVRYALPADVAHVNNVGGEIYTETVIRYDLLHENVFGRKWS